jgi:hypothetical protein
MGKLFLMTFFFWGLNAHAGSGFYGPDEAVRDALKDDLQFVGSYVPSYSQTGLATCVFRSSRVVIRANYCIKGNVQASSLRIHPVDTSRGEFEIYAEGQPGDEISNLVRSQYFDQSWSFEGRPATNPFRFDFTAAEYQAFDEKEVYANTIGCISGYTHSSYCAQSYASQLSTWGPPAEAFRTNPSSNWYKLLKVIKAKVDALP